MKKKQLSLGKKLMLSKEKIARMDNAAMTRANGGRTIDNCETELVGPTVCGHYETIRVTDCPTDVNCTARFCPTRESYIVSC